MVLCFRSKFSKKLNIKKCKDETSVVIEKFKNENLSCREKSDKYSKKRYKRTKKLRTLREKFYVTQRLNKTLLPPEY